MKKKLFIFVSLLCLPLIFLFPACASSGPSVEQVVPAKPIVSFVESEISLLPGQEYYVVPKGATDPSIELVYTSSNTDVAVVDQNGLVTAKKLGNANITVTYGESSADCAISVVSENYLPTIHLEYFAGDDLVVSLTDSVNITAYVLFNGNRYDDATYTYKFTDDTVAKAEGVFLKPTKVGKTTLIIQGSWGGFNGMTLEKRISVNVINSFEFYVNNGETIYSIHNRESVGTDEYGETEIEFNIHCLENNVAVENVVVTVEEGADVIRYDETDSKLKVVNAQTGEAKVTVSATDSDGNVHVLSFKIKVYESGPADGGYFNPDWVEEEVDDGYFNPDWVEEEVDDGKFDLDWVEGQV